MDASAAEILEPVYTPRVTEVAHAWLRTPIYRELQSEAARRCVHVDVLTAKVVAGVVVLGLVDEILDNAEALLFR